MYRQKIHPEPVPSVVMELLIQHLLFVEMLRTTGTWSDITKNTQEYWNWKIKNDYLSSEEKKKLRQKILETQK